MIGKNTFTSISETLLNHGGQNNHNSKINTSNRIIFPAIVRSVSDNAGQNRIKAEIVNVDDNGNIIPGRDKDVPTEKLPICIPWNSEILHVRPKVGETVLLFSENPSDLSSIRYWSGPMLTSQIKLNFQSFEESQSIFNPSSFSDKAIFDGPTKQNQAAESSVLPAQNEISLQGRNDSDIILKNREVFIVAGKFKVDSTALNVDNKCYIQIKQVDTNPNLTGIKSVDLKLNEGFKPFTQQNFEATNFNFISPEGKFREFDKNHEENKTNPRIKDFGERAASLHPLMYGDEGIKLLKLILQFLLNHIHTPQNAPLKNNISSELEPYLQGKLQDLITYTLRSN